MISLAITVCNEIKELEAEIQRLRGENAQLSKKYPDILTIRWISKKFAESTDIVTFPEGIPQQFANEIPLSYDRIIQVLLKKWELECTHNENTERFIIRPVEERLHDGYYLVEHKGEPEILSWSTMDGWSSSGWLVGKKMSEEMKETLTIDEAEKTAVCSDCIRSYN
jgi:hypothetical protein